MDANELVEQVAMAMEGPFDRAGHLNPKKLAECRMIRWAMLSHQEQGMMLNRARAALREIVAAAGGVDALEWSAAKVRKDEPATAALLRALAEGGKDA